MRRRRMRTWMLLVLSVFVLSLFGCEEKKDSSKKEKEEPKEAQDDSRPEPLPERQEKVVEAPKKEKKEELPEPSEFQGEARVINLLTQPDGTQLSVDVVAAQSFNARQTTLVEGLAYGEASDWFKMPKGQSVDLYRSGGRGQARKIVWVASLGPKEGERITGLLMHDGNQITVANYWEQSPTGSQFVAAPPAGKALVQLRANPLMAHEESLKAKYGGRSYYVGDGSGDCRHQRVMDKGYSMSVLGGTQLTEHDVEPGKQRFAFYKWPSSEKCAGEAVFETEIEVEADKSYMVILHTADGKELQASSFPLKTQEAPEVEKEDDAQPKE